MSANNMFQMTDGPGMQDPGYLKLLKLRGEWKTEDGSLVFKTDGSGAATVIRAGAGTLETRLSINHMLGMLAFAQAAPLPVHEVDATFIGGDTIPDADGNPLVKLHTVCLDQGKLFVELTEPADQNRQRVSLARVSDRADAPRAIPGAVIPKFCPECGTPSEGKPICPGCGYVFGSPA